MNAITRLVASDALLERLILASVELALLAVVMGLAIALFRPRSARVRAVCWLIVLAKPVVSLAIGSPIGVAVLEVAAASRASDVATEARGAPTPDLTMSLAAAPAGPAHVGGTAGAAASAAASDAGAISVPAIEPRTRPVAPVVTSWSWPLSAPATAIVAWLAGVALFLAHLLVDRLRGWRLRQRSMAAEPALLELAERLAGAAGLARAPWIGRTTELASPALLGTLRPVILVPTWMTDPRDLAWSLRHELTHLVLRDPLAACVRELAQLLFYFHPAAWWAGRRWEEAAELACDRAVVTNEAESLDYADRLCAIAHVVVQRKHASIGHGFSVARSRVARRLEVLVRAPLAASARLGRGGAAAFALIATAALAFGFQVEVAPAAAAPAAPDEDVVHLAGRVVDPEGKPVAGAPVELLRWWWDRRIPHPPLATTTSDGEGRFAVTYRKSQFVEDLARHDPWRDVHAAAFVDGFGPGWDDASNKKDGEELTLRLGRDEPVKGRVVDLEGRPVSGVAIRVTSLQANARDDLGPFLAAVRALLPPWRQHSPEYPTRYFVPSPGREPATTTDSQGRFTLRGIGAHRVAHFEARGETIALERSLLVTEPLPAPVPGDLRMGSDLGQIHGSTLELVVRPTRPIEGVVVAADTGTPLADVEVASWVFAGLNWAGEDFLRTTTDEAGRFRLVGMPKGNGNVLHVRPNDEQPYFQREFVVPDRPGLETIDVEIQVDRGIWIIGRVTDAKSGKPGSGQVHWLPFFSNPFMSEHPQLAPGGLTVQGDQQRYRVAPDGAFRVVGLPGPAVVGVSSAGRYRQGVGFEAFADEKKGPYGFTFYNPVAACDRWPTSMARIDPPADATEVRCDLVLDRGASIGVRCVDEKAEPLAGLEVCGNEATGGWTHLPGARFDVECLGPDEKRVVSIRHLGRKLGGSAVLSIAGGAVQTITLRPLVTVAGRVLDESGDPIAKAPITASRDPSIDFDGSMIRFAADDDGRFRIDELISGVDYLLSMENRGSIFVPVAPVKETKPGQQIDLGDVRLRPAG